MTRLGQMLMDEGMEKGIELKETDSIKKLMKNMNLQSVLGAHIQ